MPGPVEVPRSMQQWCAALYDYGLLQNNVSGHIGGLQCHITVTNANSNDGVGFHVSVYVPREGLIGAGSYTPDTALAKVYFFEAGGKITENWLGKNKSTIKDMPGYGTIKATADEFFYDTYPNLKPKVEYKVKDSDFPALTRT